ncbi:MAG: pyridoxamine 5'-phosphate oxidase family protein [Pseudomonadota bacterium]
MKTDQQRVQARDRMIAQRQACNALFLATKNTDGTPEASHAPCLYFEDTFWLFLSTLSPHTGNIQRTGQLSVLVIDPDASPSNAFARRRQSLLCAAEVEQRESVRANTVLDAFTAQFGDTVTMMRQLSDFSLYRLVPQSGRFIEGFGQAYELSGDGLTTLDHIGPDRFKPNTSG